MVSPRLIVVQGATASGKSELALQLAEALGAEIIGADSRQVVEGMVIGTAAPSVDEKARIPHHMIGCWKPGDEVSAGRWLRTVEDLLEGRPDQPFVVVGVPLCGFVSCCKAPSRSNPSRRRFGRRLLPWMKQPFESNSKR